MSNHPFFYARNPFILWMFSGSSRALGPSPALTGGHELRGVAMGIGRLASLLPDGRSGHGACMALFPAETLLAEALGRAVTAAPLLEGHGTGWKRWCRCVHSSGLISWMR